MDNLFNQQEIKADYGSTWVISDEDSLFRDARARETYFECPHSRARRHQKEHRECCLVIKALIAGYQEGFILEGSQTSMKSSPSLRVYDLFLYEHDELFLFGLRPCRVLPYYSERRWLGTGYLDVVYISAVHGPSLVEVGRNVKVMDLEITTSWDLRHNMRDFNFRFSPLCVEHSNSTDRQSEALRILMWNARGTFRADFVHVLRDVIDFNCPSVLVISRTLATLIQSHDNIAQLGFQHAVISDLTMFSGGLWVLWKTGRVVEGWEESLWKSRIRIRNSF